MTDGGKTREQLIGELEAMRRQEEMCQALLTAASDGISLLDADGTVLAMNMKAGEELSATPDQIVGTRPIDRLPAEVARRRKARREKVVRTGRALTYEDFHDGRWLEISISPVPDAQGRTSRVVVIARDVTERKAAEEQFRLQAKILQEMTEGVCLVRASDLVIVYVNPKMEKIFGYGPGELMGRHVSELNAPGEKSPRQVADEIAEALRAQGNWRGRVQCVKKNGATLWVRVGISAFDHAEHGPVWLSTIRNVTARVRAEESLRESEGTMRALWDAIDDAVALKDTRGTVLAVNRAGAERFGMSPEQVVGRCCFDLFPPEVAAFRKARHDEVIRSGKPVRYVDQRAGRWFDTVISPIFDVAGRLSRMAVFARDITEQRRAVEALRDSERRLRDIFEGAQNVSLIVTDLAGADARILEFSPGAERIFGYRRDEAIGRPVSMLHQARDVPAFPRVIETMRREKQALNQETTLVRKGGQEFPAILTTHPIFDAAGQMTAVLGVSIDITDRKRAEEELRQKNITLREVLARIQEEKEEVGRGVAATVDKIIMPLLGDLERGLSPAQQKLASLLRASLEEIASPFADRLGRRFAALTPTEVRICDFVRKGLRGKEIADLEHVSAATVRKHREHIRRKLGITNHKVNLATYLETLAPEPPR